MKKIFNLLLLMLPLAFLASCSNDDDFPEVDLTLTLSNVYQDESNGNLYVVEDQEENPVIDSFSAKSLISGKEAAVTNVFFSLNNMVRLFGTVEEPAKVVIPIDMMRSNKNYLNVSATVLQVDKSMASCFLDVPVYLVEKVENLPANIGELGTYSITMKMQKENK